MSELKTDTGQMANYSWKLTDRGMEMTDKDGQSMTWGKDLLSQLAKAGDPVGLKYQSLNSDSKSSVKTDSLITPISSVTNLVSGFINKIAKKSNETSNICSSLNNTSQTYTKNIEKTETALSGGKNSVSDSIVNNLISTLPDIGAITDVDFGKIWNKNGNGDFVNSWDNESSLNSIKDVKQDNNSSKEKSNMVDNKMEQYNFELTDKGMKMTDKDGVSVNWGKDLLSQLAKAGDPVGNKYSELMKQQNVSTKLDNVISIGSKIIGMTNINQISNNSKEKKAQTISSNDDIFSKNYNQESWQDYTDKTKKYADDVIAAGYSLKSVNELIDKNNDNIKKLREQVKSGKLSDLEVKKIKFQMQCYGEISKSLLQKYGDAETVNRQSNKFLSEYITSDLLKSNKNDKQVDNDIKKLNEIINNSNSSAVEKGIANQKLSILNNVSMMKNENIFDYNTNKLIQNNNDKFASNVYDYIKNGGTADGLSSSINEKKEKIEKSISQLASKDFDESSYASLLANGQLETKNLKILSDATSKLKQYEKWENSQQNQINYLLQNGVTKEEKQRFYSNVVKEQSELKKQIKSGKLDKIQEAICYRKLSILSQSNSIIETQYQKNVTFKKQQKEETIKTNGIQDTSIESYYASEYKTLSKKNSDLATQKEELLRKRNVTAETISKMPTNVQSYNQWQLDNLDAEISNIDYEMNKNNEKISAIANNVSPEMYNDLKSIDKGYEKINKWKSEMAEAEVGNSKSFYQNMISTEEAKIKKLEDKWNIDASANIKNNAIKGYNDSTLKLTELKKHKNEYTDDEYEKAEKTILATTNDHFETYFQEEHKDDWKNFISLRNETKQMEKDLINSSNSTEINQLNNKINANKAKIDNYATILNLGDNYKLNSTQTEINNLKNDNKKLKEEIESLTKKANSSSKKDDELWETIEEKKKMYSTNETLIDQKKINVNQLKNKNLMSMYEDIDKQITQLYKEDWQQNEQIQNDIESKKALSQVYLDLSKMNPDNGVENNLKYLFNQYTSNPNANDSSKKKNYIDNLTINCYAMLNSIYDSQNASESSEKKLNLEQKLGNYWLNQHPEDFETKEIEKEVDNRSDFEKIISTVGATICQTGMTVWHGVENAAESVVDFAVTAGTGITSLGTSVIDLAKGEFGNPNSLTVNLYKDLDSFVATDWVGNAADSIYNTDYGKWVENNSLYKRDDIVGNIVRGAGEVGGKLAFAAVTAGAASKIGSSATATGAISSNTFNITNALSTTTVMNPIIAGITGYGQGMESALQDGASHTGASVYATANAAWEAVQWKIGGNINNWTSKSLAESTSIAKNLGILAGSVAMDSVDSAVEGVVQPGMQMLYNGKTFEQSFNDNGGWETVGAQAALGGVMSALGTSKDFVISSKNIAINTMDIPDKVSGNQDFIVTSTKALVRAPELMVSLPYKFIETELTNDVNLSNKALNEGLLHFTSLDSAQKIIDSGEIRASKGKLPLWYDTNKAYMFAGIPEYSQLAINMGDSPSTVMVAVKVKPTDAQLGDLKFRYMDDFAVSHKGNFKFDSNQADLVYFGITRDADGNLKYREISKEMAENYDEILTKEGIKTKNGKNNTTVVVGTSSFDGINKQLDVTKNSILKTITAADNVVNNVFSKIKNIVDYSIDIANNKITAAKSRITPAGFKDGINTNIYNFEGNKVSILDKVKNNAKTVGGMSSSILSVASITSGNPLFLITGPAVLGKGIKTALNSVIGNYVKDSNFSIHRHKLTPAIDATFKNGKSYVEGNLTNDLIVTDRIGQNILDGKTFITGRLDNNQKRVFGLPLINMLQQLKTYDINNNKIIYSCESQSQTLMLLKNLAKEGYIEDLKYSKSNLSSQNLEKFLMGANVTNKSHQLYEINFKLSSDKVFDAVVASEKAKMLGFDSSLYNQKIKNINGKDVIIYEANITKMLEDVAKSKISTSALSALDNAYNIKNMVNQTNNQTFNIMSNGNQNTGNILGKIKDLFSHKNKSERIIGDITDSNVILKKVMSDYANEMNKIDYINSLSSSERLIYAQNKVDAINNNPVISKLDIFKDNADEEALSAVKNLFYDSYKINQDITNKFIDNIVKVKKDNPDFKINFLFGDGSSANNKTLNFDILSTNSLDIAIHEFGHSLDVNYRVKTGASKVILPEFKKVLENARNNCNMKAIIEYAKDSNSAKKSIRNNLLIKLYNRKADSIGTVDEVARQFNNYCKNNQVSVDVLPSDLIKQLKNNIINGNKVVEDAFNAGVLKYDYATAEFLMKNIDNIGERNLGNEIYNTFENKYMSISDPLGEFISSIVLDGNDNPLKIGLNDSYYPVGHSHEYYNDGLDNIYAELFTEFNKLKVLGDEASLNNIKTMFGEELYNFFDKQTLRVNYYYQNN